MKKYTQRLCIDTGTIKLKSGELQKAIRIPVFNDPSGETFTFNVNLLEIRGRDELGFKINTQVSIENTPSKYIVFFIV